MTSYFCEHAVIGTGYTIERDVAIEVENGIITHVRAGAPSAGAAEVLNGLTIPGLANCHSHVFHRALRGRTHGGGTFWTWREQMYALAAVIDPDLMHRLAKAVYAEMALAGFTSVGEFHYLHHGRDGVPYDDPNAMGEALVAAAREAGLRISLLDTCYLSAGFDKPPQGVQRRFSDGDADRWDARADALYAKYANADDVVIGAAIHSVRAVPADQLSTVSAWAHVRNVPLHVHLSEQPDENFDCVAATGMTPTALLAAHGVWGPRTTGVHATHLTEDDITTLGDHEAFACFCPTTERDLADGIGPSRRLHASGALVTIGSDSNAVIDGFEELRLVEHHERLLSLRRGNWSPMELLEVGAATGQESLGFGDAGVLEVGWRADLVTVGWESTRLAGAPIDLPSLMFAASAADVSDVVVDGRRVVAGGSYDRGADVGGQLRSAVDECWRRLEDSR